MDTRLCFVTPTRRRWHWLQRQVRSLVPQLGPDDRWIMVIDCDQPEGEAWEEVTSSLQERLIVIDVAYLREFSGPMPLAVNRCHNAAFPYVPPDAEIVELDDHDIIKRGAVDYVREAFSSGADYVFGDYSQLSLVDGPNGERIEEPWEDKRVTYEPGDFTAVRCRPIGLRAFTRQVWNAVGGWPMDVYPGGDAAFARAAETHGFNVVHVPQLLCTVTIDPASIMGLCAKKHMMEQGSSCQPSST